MKKHNFNSGPSILPQEVLEQSSQALFDFNGTGLSLLEIGHRTKWFQDILDEARTLVKELMQLNEEHEVLFLHGGATTQFTQVPINLLNQDATAAYCDNGIWGAKAIKEAKLFGNVKIVSSSADKNHTYIPKDFTIPTNCSYLHYTTNNTVEGTQWHTIPDVNVPLVADMSSDIFSRPLDFKKFSLIYAGAQKNIGAAGVTLVIIKKDVAGKVNREIPTILDYQKHIQQGSILNTPPVFAIYISLLTLRWIAKEGGLAEMEKRANQKAVVLYQHLDHLPIFTPTVATEDRSLMNAVFTIKEERLEKLFVETCDKEGMIGIRGHRSIGGLRVSMYNALPLESVESLCNLMKHFTEKHG